MRRHLIRAIPAIPLVLLTIVLAACTKREQPAPAASAYPTVAPIPPTASAPAVRVTDVQLGMSVGPDKKVQTPMETFAPRDTIFVSVSTDGSSPSATLHVKWTYQDGQTVKDDSRTISTSGPAATEFSIQKPGGWPKGDYKVEISIDGQPASTKSFRVG